MILILSLPYQKPVHIETNDISLLHSFQMKFGNYVHITNSSKSIDIQIAINENVYTIITSQRTCIASSPVNFVAKYLHENTVYSDKILAIHGAAVEYNEKAHLFLAASTTGKTTLCSYLVEHSMGYITDDCILIDRENFLVYPCTVPIHLRSGGVSILRRNHVALPNIKILMESGFEPRFTYVPQKCVSSPLPIERIYFISRSDSENHLSDMATTHRMTELLRSPITNYPVDGNYLRLISRLAKLNCKKLVFSDLNYVKDVICHG